jgi:predicted hydrocarbon binding protein
MQHVKISQKELLGQRKLYESVMSSACHGLFFREGNVFGAAIAEEGLKDREHYFDIVKKELIDRGWAEDFTFDEDTITVKGSIEAAKNGLPGCHRLRGILRHLYETYKNDRLHIVEQKCQSVGDEACIFKIEPVQ